MGSKIKMLYKNWYWKLTIVKKENESNNETKIKKNKFNNNSKLKVKLIIRPAARIEYLFWLSQLIKNNNIVKHVDKTPKNNKLYSISQIAREGAQIKLIQKR